MRTTKFYLPGGFTLKDATQPKEGRRVLLLNRFPYWLYNDPKYLLDGVEDLCILHANECTFDFPAKSYSTAVATDFADRDKLDQAVEYLYHTNAFDAVVNLTERYMELAARIRETYSLPGMNLKTATRFRDKLEMKKVVQAAGLNVPPCAKVDTKAEIVDFVAAHGKSILKPVDGMGTSKTFVIESVDAVPDILDRVDDLSRYEVEQFITGDMYHVDSVIINGRVELCSVSRYLNSTLDFAESGYLASVMIDQGELRDRLAAFNRQVVEVFDYPNGVTHLEVFLSEDDKLVFCEIASRAGGAGVIPSIMYVYGINLFEADIAAQLGREVHIPPPRNQCAGWLVIHSREGIVSEISHPEDFDFAWVQYKNIRAKRGDLLKGAESSVSAVAEFTVTGTSEADVIRKMDMIRSQFKLVTV